MSFYHDGHRQLQARFESIPLADRLAQVTHRTALTEDDKMFIESATYFFLATADAEGRPDCSFKGGAPGFVRVVSPALIEFPDYDGNGMFRSLGNVSVNAAVGLLFIRMDESPKRLRVNGRAALCMDEERLAAAPGAQALVSVIPEHIFPNCPRYIHNLEQTTLSPFVPGANEPPLEPKWKSFDAFKDVVPPRKDGTRGLPK